jgi:DNA-binding NarL/FixJ family response regulator
LNVWKDYMMHILLADDQPEVRSALKLLLQLAHELKTNTVSEAEDVENLVDHLRTNQPDVLLLDWGLLGAQPARELPGIRSLCPDMKVIVISGKPEVGQTAMTAGADAFVSKVEPPERLVAAIRAVS